MSRIGRRKSMSKRDPKDLSIERLRKENQGLKEHIVDLERLNQQLFDENNDLTRDNTRLQDDVETIESELTEDNRD